MRRAVFLSIGLALGWAVGWLGTACGGGCPDVGTAPGSPVSAIYDIVDADGARITGGTVEVFVPEGAWCVDGAMQLHYTLATGEEVSALLSYGTYGWAPQ